MNWKCQPAVIGTVRSQSDARKLTPITASVNPRSSPRSWRGMKSTATAPTMGRKMRTLSRCGHSAPLAATAAGASASGQSPWTSSATAAAATPRPRRSVVLSSPRGIAAATRKRAIAGQ